MKKIKPKVSDLKKLGFKRTTIKSLYITNTGKGFNIVTGRDIKTTRGKISINGKAHNVAKLVLETFCKTPIRNGQIIFKNGLKNDFHYLNLKYKSSIIQTAPSNEDLVKCIRLYYNVQPKFNKKVFYLNTT